MTIDQLADSGVMDARLPEWSDGQYIHLTLLPRLGGFGLGNWIEVWGFGSVIYMPAYQLGAPDGDRWEAVNG